MLTSTALIAAKGLILDADHWLQHGFRCEEKRCPLQAIIDVTGGGMPRTGIVEYDGDTVVLALHAAMQPKDIEQIKERQGDTHPQLHTSLAWQLVDWNDHKNRKHSDVIELFDRAIDMMKGAESGDGCVATA